MRTKPGGLPVTPRRIVLTGRGKKKGVALAEEGIGALNAQAPPYLVTSPPTFRKVVASRLERAPNRVGGLFERSRLPGASDPLVCRGDGTRRLMPLPPGYPHEGLCRHRRSPCCQRQRPELERNRAESDPSYEKCGIPHVTSGTPRLPVRIA